MTEPLRSIDLKPTEGSCGPDLSAAPAPPPPAAEPVFPTDTVVVDVSKELGITLQSPEETAAVGGGYCVMWMCWLSLQMSKNNKIWRNDATRKDRIGQYAGVYRNAHYYYTGRSVSRMADQVRGTIAEFDGRRTTPGRTPKSSETGEKHSTKGDPFALVALAAPTLVEPVRKIVRGEAKKDTSLTTDKDRRFYAPLLSKADYGYDLAVKAYAGKDKVTTSLQEVVAKGDKPVMFHNLLHTGRSADGKTNSHALLSIYYPPAFTGGPPELHVLTTYPDVQIPGGVLITDIAKVLKSIRSQGGRKTRRRKNTRRRATRRS